MSTNKKSIEFLDNYCIINSHTIPDLWALSLKALYDYGIEYNIDHGSFEKIERRLELPYFIGFIEKPWFGSGTLDILPTVPEGFPAPADLDYIYNDEDSYIKYIMTPSKQPDEDYTYGERLCKFKINENLFNTPDFENLISEGIIFKESNELFVNQIELAIWKLNTKGYGTNQVVLQIASPSDMLLNDPPCLRSIDIRVRDNKLIFYIYFRSWDLMNGLPVNLAGIEYLQKYIASCLSIEQGEMIVESKGLHVYGYAVDLVKVKLGES